jgi:hypothetical protein
MKKFLLKLFGFGIRKPVQKLLPPPLPPRKNAKPRFAKDDTRNIEQRARHILHHIAQNKHLYPSPPIDYMTDLADELMLIEPVVETAQMYALRHSIRKELAEEVRKVNAYINKLTADS